MVLCDSCWWKCGDWGGYVGEMDAYSTWPHYPPTCITCSAAAVAQKEAWKKTRSTRASQRSMMEGGGDLPSS